MFRIFSSVFQFYNKRFTGLALKEAATSVFTLKIEYLKRGFRQISPAFYG